MIQTENTAIVLRRVNYRDNDRMVTLLSPSRGRIDALIRNCRKPKSHNLNAAELFSLGDYMVVETGGRMIVTLCFSCIPFPALHFPISRGNPCFPGFCFIIPPARDSSPASIIVSSAVSGWRNPRSFSTRRKAACAAGTAAAPGPRSPSPRNRSGGCGTRSPSVLPPG